MDFIKTFLATCIGACIGALVGALSAFCLNSYQTKRKEEQEEKAALVKTLYWSSKLFLITEQFQNFLKTVSSDEKIGYIGSYDLGNVDNLLQVENLMFLLNEKNENKKLRNKDALDIIFCVYYESRQLKKDVSERNVLLDKYLNVENKNANKKLEQDLFANDKKIKTTTSNLLKDCPKVHDRIKSLERLDNKFVVLYTIKACKPETDN